MQPLTGTREFVDKCLLEQRPREALIALGELWRSQQSASAARYVMRTCERLATVLPVKAYRLAILRSFTVEPVIPILRASAMLAGIQLDIHAGGFNTWMQEILNPAGSLYASAPEAVILAVQTRDIAPELWDDFGRSEPHAIEASVSNAIGMFEQCVRAFREKSQAHLIVHSLELPLCAANGLLDGRSGPSQMAAIQKINERLRELASAVPGVYVLDYDALIAAHGRQNWLDERKWITVRMPVAAQYLSCVADEWLRFLHPLTGRIAKVLVVDLDNTLWGGLAGEDGLNGIRLGREYPGAAYLALQRALLDLRSRGILLAVCSKNNLPDALSILNDHPDMLLRPSHFAAMRINWQDKAANLREIAAELNVGLESLAFLDDNPAERQRIRLEIPEVIVLDLPHDPQGYAPAVRRAAVFERLSLSAEDRDRSRFYEEQRRRRTAELSVGSLEEFHRSLEQRIEIMRAGPGTMTRIAQLTQKTNQFNMTTRRLSEQEIAAIAGKSDWRVYAISVRDRFGDNGLTGVLICQFQGSVCHIDTFLLSCRIIGRAIETGVLAFLAQVARAQGMRFVEGWFVPTAKNQPASGVYPSHGFKEIRCEQGARLWRLSLDDGAPSLPNWIELYSTEEFSNSVRICA